MFYRLWSSRCLFGAACAAIGAKADPVVKFSASLAEVMFRSHPLCDVSRSVRIGAPRLRSPYAPKACTSSFGLGKLILTMYASLIIFVVLVLGTVVVLVRIPMRKFYEAIREPFLIAFSTASR